MMFKRTQSHFVINIFTFSLSCLVSWNFDITCSVVKILLSYKMNEREGAVHTPIFQSLRVCRFSSSRSEPLDSYTSYLYDGILLNLSKTSEKSQWKKARTLQMNPPSRIADNFYASTKTVPDRTFCLHIKTMISARGGAWPRAYL